MEARRERKAGREVEGGSGSVRVRHARGRSIRARSCSLPPGSLPAILLVVLLAVLLATLLAAILAPRAASAGARTASPHARPTPGSHNVARDALIPCPDRGLSLPAWESSWDGVAWRPADSLLNPADREGRSRWLLRTTLPPLPCGSPHLFLRTFDENVVARLDGDEIGRYVHEHDDYGYPWVLWPLPLTSAPTVLQLEVSSRGAHLGLTGTPEIGSAARLLARLVAADLPSLILGACYVAMGLAALAFFARRPRGRIAQGSFGVFVLALGAYSLSNARARQLVVDSPSFWLRTEYLVLFLVPLAGFAFFDSVFPPRGAWKVRPLPVAFAAFLVGAAAVSLLAGAHALAEMLTPFMLLCSLALPVFLVRLVQEWRSSRSPFAHALVWVCGVLVVAGGADFLASFGGRLPDVGWLKYATVGLVATVCWHLALFTAERARQEYETAVALAQQRKLSEAGRLAALGEMAGSIAHEINNPLTIIVGKSQHLALSLEAVPPDVARARGDVEKIHAASVRIARIVAGLRTLGRDATGEKFQYENAGAIVQQVVDLCRERLSGAGVELDVSTPTESFDVRCRPTQVGQVLLNLLNNAFDALEGAAEPRIRVACRLEDGPPFRAVVFEVCDDGPGIPSGLVERAFTPFFTTKPPGKGTGLGLSLSRRIAESHGGTLDYARREGWTCFSLRLPRD